MDARIKTWIRKRTNSFLPVFLPSQFESENIYFDDFYFYQLVEPDSGVKSTLFQGGTRCSANVKWNRNGHMRYDHVLRKKYQNNRIRHCGSEEVHRRSADASPNSEACHRRIDDALPAAVQAALWNWNFLTPSSEIVVNIAKLFGLLSSFFVRLNPMPQ